LNKRAVEAIDEQRPIPDIRSGDVVEIKMASGDSNFSRVNFRILGFRLCLDGFLLGASSTANSREQA